jgi:hypothetical protein
MRSQLIKVRNILEAQGRGLLFDFDFMRSRPVGGGHANGPGCGPSSSPHDPWLIEMLEHHQRLLDRQGNRRMRTLLVEAVWRLKKWNPTWRGFKKFPHVFGAHALARGATRKRAVVACARLLAIDLWRLQTGRVTLKNLGLKPAQSQ